MSNLLDYISPKFLLGNLEVVMTDWSGKDFVYDFYKFYYFLDGEATISMFNKTFYPQPGELYIIPPYTKHSYSHNPKHPIYLYWCHIELSTVLNRIFVFSSKTVKCIPKKENMVLILDNLLASTVDNSLVNILTRKSCILQLMAIFFQYIDLSNIQLQSDNAFYNTINRYIMDNLDKPIHIQDLADIVHLQPNYFINLFKQIFHVSPITYINTLRLEKAAILLSSNPQLSIELIASKSGFTDYRYFGRIFKKRYGLTPSQYRLTKNTCRP
ncbi:AraC family transcriptional regulator [Vallitalea pronyensis]|uniref:AraC family transcriptional regulator n=1 Tax=Vallitalea pronyensis TaxID=1348613 RepID=A0A8J8SIG2_9FIRM|nr:helix-turn-helix domain-containing protein [Vallitalea pronyensis]QUI24463.1 AraC family transcriptional regulator [Vallitalea pronyensis]